MQGQRHRSSSNSSTEASQRIGELPIDEMDQLLLVRNVGLDANGCLCKASRILAAALRFPHHVGAEGEESVS